MGRGRGGPMRGGRGGGGGRYGGGGMGEGPMGGGPVQPASKTGFCVHMRGLPFDSTTNDVIKFFAPLNPVDIRFLYDHSGRAKGMCDVDFSSPNDAESAMSKDKQNIGIHHFCLSYFISNIQPFHNVETIINRRFINPKKRPRGLLAFWLLS